MYPRLGTSGLTEQYLLIKIRLRNSKATYADFINNFNKFGDLFIKILWNFWDYAYMLSELYRLSLLMLLAIQIVWPYTKTFSSLFFYAIFKLALQLVNSFTNECNTVSFDSVQAYSDKQNAFANKVNAISIPER